MAWWPAVGEYLFVFGARMADVSLSTVRFMLMVRGRRAAAAAIGLVEIAIWVTALGKVLAALDNPLKIALYCLGFASGVYVGQWVEAKLAVGLVAVQIIPQDDALALALADRLREQGCGVTVLTGEGRDGPKKLLLVTLQRKGLPGALALARDVDPHAFITVLDARSAYGGTVAWRL